MEAAKAFYSQLFGWQANQVGGPEMANYTMFLLRGKEVAGLAPVQDAGQPTAWSVYIGTKDADAVAQTVTTAGGQVAMPPMDVPGAGRMGIFQDPTGAFFSVWQPGEHKGAQIVAEPGSLAWAELNTRDVEPAKPFYSQVFGWTAHTSPMGEGMTYTEWQLDGKSVAGAMPMAPMVPAEVPNFWMTYFATADVNASTARVVELGGTVLMEPMDFPGGRFSVVQDPQHATFGLLTFASPDQ